MASNSTLRRQSRTAAAQHSLNQMETDANLSAGKMPQLCTHTHTKRRRSLTHCALLVLLLSPPVCSLLSESQTGGDVCSLRLCHHPPLHPAPLPFPFFSEWHLSADALKIKPVDGRREERLYEARVCFGGKCPR